MAKKGALAKDPTVRNAAQTAQRAAANPATTPARQGSQAAQVAGQSNVPTFRHAENQAAYAALNKGQQERYTRILANKGRAAANQFLGRASGQQVVMPGGKRVGQPAPSGPPNEPPPGVPFEQLTPEQQMGEMADVGGGLYQQMAGYSGQFNPETFQQQYEGQFQGAMDRARQSVMSQFEQRNAQQFAQERQDFETAMANKGIAPGGQQYNRELQAMTDRQDRARQEAMNAAEQAAQGVQQQAFQQATGVAMMPGEIQQQYQAPVMAQYGQAAGMQTLAQQQQYAKELAALENKYRLQQIRATPRGGGGGGGGMDPFETAMLNRLGQQYQQGPQQPNPWASAAQGFAQGAGAGLTNWALKT